MKKIACVNRPLQQHWLLIIHIFIIFFVEKKYKPFAKFLEWWSDNASLAYHTLPSNSDICKISTEDTVRLNDCLKKEKGGEGGIFM